MGKATFTVEKRTKLTDIHTQRLNNFSCAITLDNKNNKFLKIKDYDEFLENAQKRYKECVKQNMQQSAILNIFQEAIISIDEYHNENDIIDLFFELKQKFGGHELINLTIHKDEGYFIKNGKKYYPHKNILKKENEWFITPNEENGKIDDDFSIKVDIDEFEAVLTPHAHAIFSMFDFSLGRNARMQKKDMVERLKFVAQILNMDYAPQKIYTILQTTNSVIDEGDLKTIDNQIVLKNSNLFEINNQVAAKELELEVLNTKLAEQYSILNDILDKVSKKESDLEDLLLQILTREDMLDSLSSAIALKNSTINNLNITIKQKEFRLDEIDTQIYTKTQSIAM